MSLTKDDIKNLAHLARIEIPEDEQEAFLRDFEGILDYVSQLESVEVSDELGEDLMTYNQFREDENAHESGAHSEDLLAALPNRDGDYAKVQKIL